MTSVSEDEYRKRLAQSPGRIWPLSVLHSIVSLDTIYHKQASVHPYLKHGPFIYVKAALRDITTTVRGARIASMILLCGALLAHSLRHSSQACIVSSRIERTPLCRAVSLNACPRVPAQLFREQTILTSTHKFRHAEDVITPFLYSGVIRSVGADRRHPKYGVDVSVEPEDEMSKFVLLSLHGIPPPPTKEKHAEKRADAWYPRLLDASNGFKHVAINDEMSGANLTVQALLHSFYTTLLPDPSETFERSDSAFVPVSLAEANQAGRRQLQLQLH